MSDAHFLQAVEQAKLEALYEFAYGAGHEINNPLATISARASHCCAMKLIPKNAGNSRPSLPRLNGLMQ